MKKVALVFVLAVIAPSLVLAWLALRSLRDQQIVLERQQTLLCQGLADRLATGIAAYLAERRREFGQHVETLIATAGPRELAPGFHTRLRETWPPAEVGFAVSLEGEMLAPSLFAGPECRTFRLDNDRFLTSRESVEVYWNSPKGAVNLSKLDEPKTKAGIAPKQDFPSASQKTGAVDAVEAKVPGKTAPATKDGKPARAIAPLNEPQAALAGSRLTAEEAEFRSLIGEDMEGAVARFLHNKLRLLFWYRSPRDPQLVFGVQLRLDRLVDDFRRLVRVEPEWQDQVVAGLIDDMAKPVALSQPQFQADWKRPFVATEIGEVLPHWEVAVYLRNPSRLNQAARSATLTLGLLIVLLVLAIGVGSWLIVADLKRQLTLARQKTDFVSNVSHELKTPLTSIRMFSEILAEGRVQDEAKRRSYLNIITAETARLTRLINNVLDFARIDRGEKEYRFERLNLPALVRATVDTYRPQLEASGFELVCQLPQGDLLVKADRDSIAQVLVNLVSNAEKYSDTKRQVEVEVSATGPWAEVSVRDRGLGVPPGCEDKIFEQFYRAHDSLSSGAQGSGLGLTLARQIARAHGGDVLYQSRDGGGSSFTLRLPMTEQVEVSSNQG